MAGLLDELRKSQYLQMAEDKLQGLLNIPTEAQRFITNPQAFMSLLGRNELPRETGFAAGATGLPPKNTASGGVLNPESEPYTKGYEEGIPVGLLASIAPFTKGMPVGASIKDVSQDMAKAMKIAQKNAALPIEKGGLGLPKNNTPMDRARAMGYETPVYHGTNEDINAFNVSGKGKTSGAGAFVTTNPTLAETYVSSSGGGNILPLLLKKDEFLNVNARGRNWADIWTNQLSAKSGKKRYTPEELGLDINSATSTDELGMIAKDLGKKGIEIKNVKDLGTNSHVMRAKDYLLEKYGIIPDETWSNVTGKQWDEAQKAMKKFYELQKSDIYAVQDPSLLRSKFAAFDPMLKNSPNLLSGFIPFGLLNNKEED